MPPLVKPKKDGSPAWAGIDRRAFPTCETSAGFPRVGGDRPEVVGGAGRWGVVPPRGRG